MLTFRYKRSLIVFQFISLLIPLSIGWFVGYVGFALSLELEKPFSNVAAWTTSIFVLFFLFIALWLGLNLYATWKARLILDETFIQVKSLKKQGKFIPFSGKSFLVEYENISIVRAKHPGAIEIIEKSGVSNFIALSFFDKYSSEEVVRWLYAHVPAENIESNLSERLNQRQKVSKARLIPLYFFAVVVLFHSITNIDFFRSRLTHAWTKEYSFRIFEYAQEIQVDGPQAGFWILANGMRDEYSIYQYREGDVQKWNLSEGEGPGNDPQLISHDENGLPVIWFGKGVMRFENGWNSNVYDSNLVVGDFDLNHGVALGNTAWVVIDIDDRRNFIELDALTGNWVVMQLPESANQKEYSPQLMWSGVNGEIMVLMSNETGSTVYVWSGQEWKPQEYPVDITLDSSPSDYFLDSDGNLWVLSSFLSLKDYSIKKITPNGETQITQLPQDEENSYRYDSLIVDSHGRIWVSGGYPLFMEVFFPVWNGYAESLVKYTEANSNFQGGLSLSPVMSLDGIIWSASDVITSINSNVKELPSPMPDWVVWLADRKRLLYVYPFMLLYFLYFLWKDTRASKRRYSSAVKSG